MYDFWRSVDDPPETAMACIVYDEGSYYVADYVTVWPHNGYHVDGETVTTATFWMPLFKLPEDKQKIADAIDAERKDRKQKWLEQYRERNGLDQC